LTEEAVKFIENSIGEPFFTSAEIPAKKYERFNGLDLSPLSMQRDLGDLSAMKASLCPLLTAAFSPILYDA